MINELRETESQRGGVGQAHMCAVRGVGPVDLSVSECACVRTGGKREVRTIKGGSEVNTKIVSFYWYGWYKARKTTEYVQRVRHLSNKFENLN